MNLWILDHLIKKNNLHCLNKLGSRELYQMQISEKYEKPISQLYYERYFNKLPRMVSVDTKLRGFSVQNTKQYSFCG